MYLNSGWVGNAAICEVKDKKILYCQRKGTVSAKLANINVTYLPNIYLGFVNFSVTVVSIRG